MTRKCPNCLTPETAKESGACPAASGNPLRAGSCLIPPSPAAVAAIIITSIMEKIINAVPEHSGC